MTASVEGTARQSRGAKPICVITGGTAGVGAAAAEGMARRGYHVVIVGRDAERGHAVAARCGGLPGGGSADFVAADLSSMAEVRRVARTVEATYPPLSILVNNAGGIFMRRSETVDGIERTFALNHLTYFLLTTLLLDRLRAGAPARVVNVASAGHALVRSLDLDNLQGRGIYRGFRAYHQSKLANILFTYELARRLAGSGVTVNALHPGMVRTSIGWNNGYAWRVAMPLLGRVMGYRYVTAEEGARTVVYLACSPDVAGTTGQYFVDARAAESSPLSRDAAIGRRLWDACVELVARSGARAEAASSPDYSLAASSDRS